jgi:protocatechuate 3,4-dioxygenase beta subunit
MGFLLAMCAGLAPASGQSLGTVQIKVTDPSGAAIPGASVTITGANGAIRTGATDVTGQLRLDALAAGTYAIRIASPNFIPFQRDALVVSAAAIQTLNVRLEIQGQTSKVTVSENVGLSVDPSQNASQLVLKGSDLDSLYTDLDTSLRPATFSSSVVAPSRRFSTP